MSSFYYISYSDGAHDYALDSYQQLNEAESEFNQHVAEHAVSDYAEFELVHVINSPNGEIDEGEDYDILKAWVNRPSN